MENKLHKLLLPVLAALLLFACLPGMALADEAGNNSLAVKFSTNDRDMAGVEFRLYRVADVDKQKLTAAPVAPYDEYNVFSGGTDWLDMASTLAGYISRDKLPAAASAQTDAGGVARFSGLADGMYLIVGDNARIGRYTYRPAPFLLFLPNTTDGYSWDSSVETNVKYTRRGGGDEPGNQTRSLRALKVWADNGHEDARPGSVTVDLLKDGEVIGSAELSAGNNWRYDWNDLDADAEYEIVERAAGENYTVSVTEGGVTFVVTNTYHEPDEEIPDDNIPLIDKPGEGGDHQPGKDPGEGGGELEIPEDEIPLKDLPNTGQLWWPVPILFMAGLVLLAMGVVVRRRSLYDEE